MKRILICACALCLLCAEESFGGLRSSAQNRRNPWGNSHYKNDTTHQHTRYRTMRYGPDVLFKRIRCRNIVDHDDKNDSEYTKQLKEYFDKLDDILTKDPFDKSLFTSTGYHVLTAPIFFQDLDAFKKLIESLDDSQIFQPLDPMNNNVLHLCAMLNLHKFVQYIIEYMKDNKSSFQLRKALYAQNCANNTPAYIAECYGDKKVLELLNELSSNQSWMSRNSSSYSKNNATSGAKYTSKKGAMSKKQQHDDRFYDNDEDNKTRSKKWGINSKKHNHDDNAFSEEEEQAAFDRASYDRAFICIMNGDFEPLIDKLKTTPTLLTQRLDLFDNNLFHILALFGEVDLIKEIIAEQDKTNRREVWLSLNAGNKIKSTPVHVSASMNDFFVTEALLTYNDIDLSIQNASDVTPLMLLLRNYKEYQSEKEEAFEHIHALVIYKPESNYANPMLVRDGYGNTAYHFACMQGSLKNIVELALYGGNIYAQDNVGRTGEDKLAAVPEERFKDKERFKAFGDIMDHIYKSYNAFYNYNGDLSRSELQKALQTGRNFIKMNTTDANSVIKDRRW